MIRRLLKRLFSLSSTEPRQYSVKEHVRYSRYGTPSMDATDFLGSIEGKEYVEMLRKRNKEGTLFFID